MNRWALQRRVTCGIALGLGRLYEAHGDGMRARHHYQLSAFLAPEGPVAGLVARLPRASVARVDEADMTGGSLVRTMLVALRDYLVGLPWAEGVTTVEEVVRVTGLT